MTIESAAKLVESVQEAIKKATIVTWAVGSGLFGRGIGTKRLGPAFAIVEAHKGTRGAELTALIAAIASVVVQCTILVGTNGTIGISKTT